MLARALRYARNGLQVYCTLHINKLIFILLIGLTNQKWTAEGDYCTEYYADADADTDDTDMTA
jgi:hypothetical protein